MARYKKSDPLPKLFWLSALVLFLAVGVVLVQQRQIINSDAASSTCYKDCMAQGNGSGECNVICKKGGSSANNGMECWNSNDCGGGKECRGGVCKPKDTKADGGTGGGNTQPQITPVPTSAPKNIFQRFCPNGGKMACNQYYADHGDNQCIGSRRYECVRKKSLPGCPDYYALKLIEDCSRRNDGRVDCKGNLCTRFEGPGTNCQNEKDENCTVGTRRCLDQVHQECVSQMCFEGVKEVWASTVDCSKESKSCVAIDGYPPCM